MNDDLSAAANWLHAPAAAGYGSLVPYTHVVPYDHLAMLSVVEHETPPDDEWHRLIADVWEATEIVKAVTASRSVFVRTDLSSAKHDGPIAYQITSRDDIERVIASTIADNEMKFWLTGPTPSAFLIREWLDIDADAPFTAFGGHPIGREWRYFATDDGTHQCHHYYWPEAALNAAPPPDPQWRDLRSELEADPPPDHLAVIAAAVAAAAPDTGTGWSIDFARANGRWWIIDMADASRSWHEHD